MNTSKAARPTLLPGRCGCGTDRIIGAFDASGDDYAVLDKLRCLRGLQLLVLAPFDTRWSLLKFG